MKPALTLDEPTATGWLRAELYGDKDIARQYLHAARTVLGGMKSRYGVNERIAQGEGGGFYHQWATLPDGSSIHAMTNDGHDTLRIYAARPVIPQEKKERIMEVEPTILVACGDYGFLIAGPAVAFLPFVWTPTRGLEALPLLPDCTYGTAAAISKDGSTIVGTMNPPSRSPYIWRRSTGTVALPGVGTWAPTDVSADGAIVVGMDSLGAGKIYKWTEAEGLEEIATGIYTGAPPTISPNGRYIAYSTGSTSANCIATVQEKDGTLHVGSIASQRAVDVTDAGRVLIYDFGAHLIWDLDSGDMLPITGMNDPNAMSERGVVAGLDGTDIEAAFWTADGGVTLLPPGPQTFVSSVAFCISSDGTAIGGSAALENQPNNDAPSDNIAFWRRLGDDVALTRITMDDSPLLTIYGGHITGITVAKQQYTVSV